MQQQGTGGGANIVKDLSDMEERLMSLLGWVTVTGDPTLIEAGLAEIQEETPVIILDESEEHVSLENSGWNSFI